MLTLNDLYKMAEESGVVVDEFPMKKCVSFSLMDLDGGCYIAIDPLKLQSSQQERIILGHELGHCQTGSFYNSYSSFDIRKRHENRADKWSIIHLVPEKELNEAISAGFTQVWQLAEYFDVPCEFMAKALHWYRNRNMNFPS